MRKILLFFFSTFDCGFTLIYHTGPKHLKFSPKISGSQVVGVIEAHEVAKMAGEFPFRVVVEHMPKSVLDDEARELFSGLGDVKTTLEASGEDLKTHSKRVEKI